MISETERRICSYLERPVFFPEPTAGKADPYRICRQEEEILQIEDQVGSEYRAKGLNPDWARVGLWYEDPHCWLVRDAIVFWGASRGCTPPPDLEGWPPVRGGDAGPSGRGLGAGSPLSATLDGFFLGMPPRGN